MSLDELPAGFAPAVVRPAFTLGGNGGVVLEMSSNVDMFGQVGIRWVSGMSAIDNLEGTGLETINDKSGRWTVPFLTGVRFRF